MAGAFVSVDVLGAGAIQAKLRKMIGDIENTAPAFREIGEHLLESTQARFEQQVTPDGDAWEPLSSKTVEQKARSGQSDKIMRGYGTLADTFNYQLGDEQLMFGTPMEYAAAQHFGREEINLPARALLGFSDEDETEILAVLAQHIEGG